MLHTKVHGNRSTGSKEEYFKAFYHIWARKPSGHTTNIILTYFHFLVPKSLHMKFGKKKFKWFLRTTSFNLDIEYSYTCSYFIYSSTCSCLHLPMFRSQAARVSKKSTVFTFSKFRNFDLVVK